MASGPIKFAILAADTALLSMHDGVLHVRLIRVQRPPHFPDMRGLPGGLIAPDESAETAAKRHVDTKATTNSTSVYFEQLYTFDDLARDPRGRVVAVAYLALVPWEKLSDEEKLNSDGAEWMPVKKAKKLAYDHDEILAMALARLRSKITYTTMIQKLMPAEFTLTELESAYECILGTELDKRNFRKKILKLDILKPLKKKRAGGAFRPAQLYSFASSAIQELELI